MQKYEDMQAGNGEEEGIQMMKTKRTEKLSDNTSESLPMLTSLSRLIPVCSALLIGLSFLQECQLPEL